MNLAENMIRYEPNLYKTGKSIQESVFIVLFLCKVPVKYSSSIGKVIIDVNMQSDFPHNVRFEKQILEIATVLKYCAHFCTKNMFLDSILLYF